MTSLIAVRDITKVLMPLGIFIGLYGQGALWTAGLAMCAVCIWHEIRSDRRAWAANASESVSGADSRS